MINLPADFTKCISDGGRVRTISGPNKKFGLSKQQYVAFCFKGGKSYRGEVKTKESKK